MNNPCQVRGTGIGYIILLIALYIIFNPVPGPIEDTVLAALGGYHALNRQRNRTGLPLGQR